MLEDVDIDKTLYLRKYGENPLKKHYYFFVGYRAVYYKIKSFCIMLSKLSAYTKSYDGQTKWMKILIKDDEFCKKI